MIVLSGDIGATNSRLAILKLGKHSQKGSYTWLAQANFKNIDFRNFNQVLATFCKLNEPLFKKISGAAFGIAGPIQNANTLKAKVEVTNLPWIITAMEVSKFLKIKKTWLLNDLEAIAHGIDLLPSNEIKRILGGKSNQIGNRAVIAPGSGIGEALLYWNGHTHNIIATEGGHCSFSPTGATQIKLLEHLSQEFQHVSWERVLSGPGIYNLYKFLKTHQLPQNSKNNIESMPEFKTTNPSALISQQALIGKNKLCSATIRLFIDILANEAGNLALKSLAHNGVYIAGGIVPKVAQLINNESFYAAFTNKGRMKNVLKDIPVHLILNDKVGILGAAKSHLLAFP